MKYNNVGHNKKRKNWSIPHVMNFLQSNEFYICDKKVWNFHCQKLNCSPEYRSLAQKFSKEISSSSAIKFALPELGLIRYAITRKRVYLTRFLISRFSYSVEYPESKITEFRDLIAIA